MHCGRSSVGRTAATSVAAPPLGVVNIVLAVDSASPGLTFATSAFQSSTGIPAGRSLGETPSKEDWRPTRTVAAAGTSSDGASNLSSMADLVAASAVETGSVRARLLASDCSLGAQSVALPNTREAKVRAPSWSCRRAARRQEAAPVGTARGEGKRGHYCIGLLAAESAATHPQPGLHQRGISLATDALVNALDAARLGGLLARENQMQDGRLVAHLHQPPPTSDLRDYEWRTDHLGTAR